MAELRRGLLTSLRESLAGEDVPRVAAVVKPPGGADEKVSCFTFVVLDDGMAGLCFNLLPDPQSRQDYDAADWSPLVGKGALEVAEELWNLDIVHRVIGYAACSALSQLLFRRGAPVVEETDLFALLDPQQGDHVGVVGYAPPMVRRIAKSAGQVTVLERREKKGGDNILVTAEAEELGGCNKVLVTSTTLLNDTLGDIARITAGASFRALYGPGAGILPTVFFQHGFQAVAGLQVIDPEALVERQRTGKRWGDAKRKIVVRAERPRSV